MERGWERGGRWAVEPVAAAACHRECIKLSLPREDFLTTTTTTI